MTTGPEVAAAKSALRERLLARRRRARPTRSGRPRPRRWRPRCCAARAGSATFAAYVPGRDRAGARAAPRRLHPARRPGAAPGRPRTRAPSWPGRSTAAVWRRAGSACWSRSARGSGPRRSAPPTSSSSRRCAVARDGVRLGRGGGYYDRALRHARPGTVAGGRGLRRRTGRRAARGAARPAGHRRRSRRPAAGRRYPRVTETVNGPLAPDVVGVAVSPEIVTIIALVVIFAIATFLPINMGALAFVAAFLVGHAVGRADHRRHPRRLPRRAGADPDRGHLPVRDRAEQRHRRPAGPGRGEAGRRPRRGDPLDHVLRHRAAHRHRRAVPRRGRDHRPDRADLRRPARDQPAADGHDGHPRRAGRRVLADQRLRRHGEHDRRGRGPARAARSPSSWAACSSTWRSPWCCSSCSAAAS